MQHVLALNQLHFGVDLFLAHRVVEHHGGILLRSDDGIHAFALHQQFGFGPVLRGQDESREHHADNDSDKAQDHHALVAKANRDHISRGKGIGPVSVAVHRI